MLKDSMGEKGMAFLSVFVPDRLPKVNRYESVARVRQERLFLHQKEIRSKYFYRNSEPNLSSCTSKYTPCGGQT